MLNFQLFACKLKEILASRNCKVSGWQKANWPTHFFCKISSFQTRITEKAFNKSVSN